MAPFIVSIVPYKTPLESVRKAVEMSRGLAHMPRDARVFIKPNIAYWTRAVPFPKWGVVTTSRVVHDMVLLLKEHGVRDIVIGEGTVTWDPRDRETARHICKTLGYHILEKRYGIKFINTFERPFERVDLGDGIELHFNRDILQSDFVVNLPVLKTHNQTKVSLGTKNLKGTIDITSRKKCHSADPEKDLNYMVSRLPLKMPPMFVLVDGIYSNERGPAFDGRLRRSDILVASADLLSADMAGAKIMGFDPADVPHLAHVAANQGRPLDLSDVEIVGRGIDEVASPHAFDHDYMRTKDGVLPKPMADQGIQGLSYPKYDLSMCTYCSGINGLILNAIRSVWEGRPWDDIEVLTGKIMTPSSGKKKTLLIGRCMVRRNRDDPRINEMIAVKGCPPKTDEVVKALHRAGIPVNPALFENMEKLPGFFMRRYEGNPDFDENFFRIE